MHVNTEYGKLHDAFIGIGDRLMMDPPYHESLKWQDKTAPEWTEKYGGKLVAETRPAEVKEMQEEFDELAGILKGKGAEVFRSHSLRHKEEIAYLDNVHKGYCNHDGCDFFLTIGNNVILLNNLRTPCRRKRVWAVRDILEPALIVARLYKCRWTIELFFKWIKQHLRIKKFYGTSFNAAKTQIWIAICVYLLVAILKKELALPQSLHNILQVLSVSTFEKVPIYQLLTEEARRTDMPNVPNQLLLNI